jgi:hypothetical protein
VFQEVTSERGKKRALVTTTRHLIWNAVPGDTTECYDRARDPAEERDIWQRSGRRRSCAALARPPAHGRRPRAADGRGREARAGVHAPGAPRRPPAHSAAGGAGRRRPVRGYDLSAAEVAAGDSIDVTYHFEARARIAAGWRLFFHLEGPAGKSQPGPRRRRRADAARPLAPGQRIADRQRIAIPASTPRGVYTLYVGAFKGPARMKVAPAALSDGKDRLRLLQFTVR